MIKEYLYDNGGSMFGLFISLFLWYLLTPSLKAEGINDWLLNLGFILLYFTSYILTENGHKGGKY